MVILYTGKLSGNLVFLLSCCIEIIAMIVGYDDDWEIFYCDEADGLGAGKAAAGR